MKTRGLQINHLRQPEGIDGKQLTLTWKCEDGKEQSAFRVKVYERFPGRRLLEDSGERPSAQMRYTLKKTVAPRTRIEIVLTVWDENREASPENRIEAVTGIERSAWKAKWICPEEEEKETGRQPASYVRKKFFLGEREKEKEAYLYFASHGIINVYINGISATKRQLMPGTTQANRRLMTECLRVERLLRQGENKVLFTIGDGWYRGSVGYEHTRNIFGTDLAVIAQLEIDREPVLLTDETWEASQNGPLGKNDLMDGEEYDARKARTMTWHGIRVGNFGLEQLICTDTVPILPKETFHARKIITPAGETVLDFGQNLAGYVEFCVQAKEGWRITLVHGETLDENGNFTIQNFQNAKVPTKQQVDYICTEGMNRYYPTKTYFGFRYVKVTADFEIHAEDFTAVAIYSDMEEVTRFSCGVKEVEQLFSNALWSMKGNFVDVPTDCPTREKSGYSGDCQTFVKTALYLMDCYAVYAKWVKEQASTLFSDGTVAQIAPSVSLKKTRMDGGIGWSDAIVLIPYTLTRHTGEGALAEELYPVMQRWVESLIRRARKTKLFNRRKIPKHFRPFILDSGWMWGEWLEPEQDDVEYMKTLILHGDPEVGTAYLYYDCMLLGEMAQKLGKEDDAGRYFAYAAKVRQAYRAVFAPDGNIAEQHRQCRYVRPIAMGLLDQEECLAAAEKLTELIRTNGNKLNTGFLSTHELCRVLSSYGQNKTACELLLQKEKPGWLFAVKRGCTTIPESWNCFDEKGRPAQSFNHYAYGAIAGWLINECCGIHVQDGEILLRPRPDERLGYARAEYDSPLGKIVSGWSWEAGMIRYHFSVPANGRANICLEGEKPVLLSAGDYKFERRAGMYGTENHL